MSLGGYSRNHPNAKCRNKFGTKYCIALKPIVLKEIHLKANCWACIRFDVQTF
jgi:hypothetical protein